VRKATGGVIEIDGEPVVIHSPRAAIDLGIGFLTENRKEQGLFLELAAQENITMATIERDASYGLLDRKKRSPSPMTPSSYSISASLIHRCGRGSFRRQSAKAADIPLGRHRAADPDPR
jgi:ABC-type uncharacterized transport system ATPase subunit